MKTLVKKEQAGFSLIEMVLAIVISGILAIGVVSFIGDSVDSLTTSSNRNKIATSGRIAIDRLAMELHNALPNSIRATAAVGGDQCIEFVPVRAATSYINPPFGAAGGTQFDVVDFLPSQEGVTGGYAVIYPNRVSRIYDGENPTATGFRFRGMIEEITDIQDATPAGNLSEVTLAASHRFRRRSPARRFFVVEQPVSYCVDGSNLYRYTNYGFYDNQPDTEDGAGCSLGASENCLPNYTSAPDKMLITDSIDNATAGITAFTVGTQNLTRNSLVEIEINFTSNGDSITLNHDVLSRSVP
jgi:MSHA biogenesis protein MshO